MGENSGGDREILSWNQAWGQQSRGECRVRKRISWGHCTGLAPNWRILHILKGLGFIVLCPAGSVLTAQSSASQWEALQAARSAWGRGLKPVWRPLFPLTEVLRPPYLSLCLAYLPVSSTSDSSISSFFKVGPERVSSKPTRGRQEVFIPAG